MFSDALGVPDPFTCRLTVSVPELPLLLCAIIAFGRLALVDQPAGLSDSDACLFVLRYLFSENLVPVTAAS